MPEKMLEQYCSAKTLFSASEMQMQVFYSLLDQKYHGPHPLDGSTTEILARLQNRYYGIPYVENTVSFIFLKQSLFNIIIFYLKCKYL